MIKVLIVLMAIVMVGGPIFLFLRYWPQLRRFSFGMSVIAILVCVHLPGLGYCLVWSYLESMHNGRKRVERMGARFKALPFEEKETWALNLSVFTAKFMRMSSDRKIAIWNSFTDTQREELWPWFTRKQQRRLQRVLTVIPVIYDTPVIYDATEQPLSNQLILTQGS